MTSPQGTTSPKVSARVAATAYRKISDKSLSLFVTAVIICVGICIVWIFKEPINRFGVNLISRYGQGPADLVLLLFTAVSCTPLVLPVWGYALAGVALGYNIFRLAAVMALGSTLGSSVSYAVGRCFSENAWIKRRFPNLLKHPWSEGKSKTFIGWLLFLGTASPIPCDAFYAVSGVKRLPLLLFVVSVLGGRFVRYLYLAVAFKYLEGYF